MLLTHNRNQATGGFFIHFFIYLFILTTHSIKIQPGQI